MLISKAPLNGLSRRRISCTAYFRYLPIILVLALWLLFYQLRHDQKKTLKIGIISILDNRRSSRAQYKTATDSMECYSLQNSYDFITVNASQYDQKCPHKDFNFKRHCIVANILQMNSYDWILFIDSDIGVVNEKIKLEKYIRAEADVIFYDRYFNFEVMAGSYFVRKTDFAVKFLHGWADYEKRIPKMFNGSDNGAIHMYLVELFAPNSVLIPRCWKLWNDTVNFETLTLYTLCCREALKTTNFSEVFIYEKGKGWARDAWLTNSYWSPERDFMFHSLKERDLEEFTLGKSKTLQPKRLYWSWFNTLNVPLDLDECRKGRMQWSHVQELIASKDELEAHMNKLKKQVEEEYQRKLYFAYKFD